VTATLTISIPFQPNPKQAEAHKLKAKYRGFVGGWGNGKTSWGCMEFFLRLQEFPGTNAIVARKTRPELRSTTWDMLLNGDTQETGWRGIPRELIQVNNKADMYLELRTNDPDKPSRVHGLPLDDPKKIENYNLGLFWIDQAEEIEEDIFLKFQGRLRQVDAPREGLLTWNPNGHNWLWRRFIDRDRAPEWQRLYKCVEATTYDNPNLPPDYLEQFEGLPDAWIQRFVLGSHEVFVGQIFTDYNPDIHVVQPFRIPRHWERWFCFDPGMRHEASASWLARSPSGDCFYYREHLEPNQPVDWWAAYIMDVEDSDDIGGPEEDIFRRLIGPESKQRSQRDGKSVLEMFYDCGLYPEPSDRNPGARIQAITQALRPRTGHLHPLGFVDGAAPSLYVFDTCFKLKEYLPQYRWKPQRTNFTEEQPAEEVRKKDDHNIDNLGHILLAISDLPSVEGDPEIPRPQRSELDEHFERELSRAARRNPLRGYPHRPRKEEVEYV